MASGSGRAAGSTRRQFLRTAGLGLGAMLLPGATSQAVEHPADEPAVARYASRPDLSPPAVAVTTADPTTSPGYVFLAPSSGSGQHGPLVVDDRGEPVWFLPVSDATVHNFRAQRFAGRPVLTWWEGEVTNGYGRGDYVIADDSYRVIKRFSPANGYRGDLHEFLLTPHGSAFVSIYNEVRQNLAPDGGPAYGSVLEGVVQELDLRTGKVLFEWHSLEHVGIDESYRPDAGGIWDYFHLNSIDVLDDGDLLVSARHTSTVYKLDRRTGRIVWRLGGRKDDFAAEPGTTFAFQHDARGHPGGLVSIFDDGAYSEASAIEPTSRTILLALDTKAMSVRLVHADANPQGSLTTAMGSAQVLADGGMFAGWGTIPSCSEFSAAGELRFDAHLPGGGTSYRAHRSPWTARPAGGPAVAASAVSDGSLDVYASWNGATGVTHWRILGGSRATALAPLRTVPRDGFETAVRLAPAPNVVAAVALDAGGRALGTSPAVAT